MIDQTSIPSKTPVIDPRTGLMDRLWQRYLLQLQSAAYVVLGECVLTITGCVTSPTRVWQYMIIGGDFVVLSLKIGEVDHTAVSNANTLTFIGLPPAIQPIVDVSGRVNCLDNSIGVLGLWYINPASPGVIRMFRDTVIGTTVQASDIGWTAGNSKGLFTQDQIIYRLRNP